MNLSSREQESICALSTPVGTGALAIVRLSGPRALTIATLVAPFLPQKPESHRVYFGRLVAALGGPEFDEALVTYFATGRSFTGEETLEFSTHGSQVIVQELLKALIQNGAKAAEKGEFTYRAFMNGKMDLVQAESVLALIESQSSLSAKQALRQLKGGLSKELEDYESEITWGLAHIEAGIDFSTEGLETVAPQELLKRLGKVADGLKSRLSSYRQGRLVKEGLQVVLIGRPNVGKSSLLNAVLDEERAIVTAIAGTTRDLIEAPLLVGGVRVNFVDTAGLRDAQDLVEQIGIERTQAASREADLNFFIFESGSGLLGEELRELELLDLSRVFLIANKSDQLANTDQLEPMTHEILQKKGLARPARMLFVSALDKSTSRQTILAATEDWLSKQKIEDQSLLFQARHFEKLSQAQTHLIEGMNLVEQGLSPELAAIDLKDALLCVQETLGKHFDDQVLDRVFKEFCLGK